jgi:DNA-cytosine methyltransferase
MDNPKIDIIDLFSGYGGFSLGFEQAGFEIENHYYSEIDPHAIACYKHNFPHAKYLGSVTEQSVWDIPRTGNPIVVTFGSPCQDFSLAGRREGLTGAKSSLIEYALLVVERLQPDFFIWENVKGVFSSNAGADFWAIIQAFTNLGPYRLEWELVNSSWFVPQNRERVYVIGHLAVTGRSFREVFPIGENDGIPASERVDTAPCISALTASDGKGPSKQRPNLVVPAIKKTQEAYSITMERTEEGKALRKKYEAGEIEHGFNEHRKPSIKEDGISLTLDSSEKSRKIVVKQEAKMVKVGALNSSQDGQVYSDNGISPCLSAGHGNMPKVAINSATKSGYEEATEGDSINLSMPNSKTRRGRVGKGIAQTLDTQCNQAVIQVGTLRTHKDGEGFREMQGGISPTLSARARQDGSGQPIIAVQQVNASTESGGKQPYQQNRVYDANGLSPCLDQGAGRWSVQPSVISHYGHKNKDAVVSKICPTLKAESHGHTPMVTVQPVLTPDRAEKRQNGRRIKEDGEPAFTLTAQDKHGIMTTSETETKIRRLTEVECERLQGLPDFFTKWGIYQDKNGNEVLKEISSTQRYKMCGNGVTVSVTEAIARKIKKYFD